jgi:hypothetical protein
LLTTKKIGEQESKINQFICLGVGTSGKRESIRKGYRMACRMEIIGEILYILI